MEQLALDLDRPSGWCECVIDDYCGHGRAVPRSTYTAPCPDCTPGRRAARTARKKARR